MCVHLADGGAFTTTHAHLLCNDVQWGHPSDLNADSRRLAVLWCDMWPANVMLGSQICFRQNIRSCCRFPPARKIGVTCGYCCIYMFLTELMPTVVRNMGLGMASSADEYTPSCVRTSFTLASIAFLSWVFFEKGREVERVTMTNNFTCMTKVRRPNPRSWGFSCFSCFSCFSFLNGY